jgi:hypothetical protein
MNRILTDLRNRLTTEHLEQLMRISIEGPSDLDNDPKDLIISCWKQRWTGQQKRHNATATAPSHLKSVFRDHISTKLDEKA